VDNILLGYGEVANGTQPSISYAYAPDQINTKYTYDPEKAKQLLADAGWTDSNGNGTVDKDGVEMDFEFLYPSGIATNDTMVAYFQDAWKAVGIGIKPVAMEFPALIEATTTNPTFEMALYSFGWDSTFIQDAMFGCDQYQVGFNDMKYCNPDLDALGEQIKVTVDQEKRAQLMIQYSNIVNDEQPVGIINFSVAIAAWNNRMHNSFPGPWGGPGIEYIWLEQ
jgi:peptide/nickel transport system substrate-binding protein